MKLYLCLFLLLSGCAFSPSFNGPKFNRDTKKLNADPEQLVVLAITNATLDRSKRKGFDQRSRDIFPNLKENPGYMGGTVYVEIFGDQVWTMTLWENKQSLERFVNGRKHLDAMYMTNQAMTKFRSTHLEMKAKQFPITWQEAKEKIESIEYKSHVPF